MKVESAINRSGIWTAFRPVSDRTSATSQPVIAAKHLTGFNKAGTPIYKVRCYTYQGVFAAPVLAHRFEDWLSVEPLDAITALANLNDREQIVARQHAMVERKKSLHVRQGREHELYRQLMGRLEARLHMNDVVEGINLRDDGPRHPFLGQAVVAP